MRTSGQRAQPAVRRIENGAGVAARTRRPSRSTASARPVLGRVKRYDVPRRVTVQSASGLGRSAATTRSAPPSPGGAPVSRATKSRRSPKSRYLPSVVAWKCSGVAASTRPAAARNPSPSRTTQRPPVAMP